MARPSPLLFLHTSPYASVSREFLGSQGATGEMPNDSNVAVHVSKARSGPR